MLLRYYTVVPGRQDCQKGKQMDYAGEQKKIKNRMENAVKKWIKAEKRKLKCIESLIKNNEAMAKLCNQFKI